MNLKTEKSLLILVFTVAFFLRLHALINLPPYFKLPRVDAKQYDDLAVNLLAGRGYETYETGTLTRSWKPPAYPLFLAFIYFLFGHNYTAVGVIQCLLGALQCLIIFYIAKIIFSRRIAFISLLVMVIYKPFIWNKFWGPGSLFSDNFFSFFFSVLVYFLVKNFFPQPTIKNSILSGILIAIIALTRPIIAMFPLLIFILFIIQDKCSILPALKKVLPLFLAFFFVISPWTIRNYFVHRAFMPFSSEGGFVFYSGNNPNADGGGLINFSGFLSSQEIERINRMSELERDREYRIRGREFLLNNYRKIPRLFLKKLMVMWDVFNNDYDLGSHRSYNVWYAIVFIFSLIGMVAVLKRGFDINTALIVLTFCYLSLIAMIFCGDQRFRYFVEPYLIIFASVGLFSLQEKIKSKSLFYCLVFLIIVLNISVYFNSQLLLSLIRKII